MHQREHLVIDHEEWDRHWDLAYGRSDEADYLRSRRKTNKQIRMLATTSTLFYNKEPDYTGPRYTIRERINLRDFKNQTDEFGPILTRFRKRTKKDFELK